MWRLIEDLTELARDSAYDVITELQMYYTTGVIPIPAGPTGEVKLTVVGVIERGRKYG